MKLWSGAEARALSISSRPRDIGRITGIRRAKEAAWLQFQDRRLIGQITVWETGECELEAIELSTEESRLREHRDLRSISDLRDALSALLDLFVKG